MSIIYEALKKIEKKEINRPLSKSFYLFSNLKQILLIFGFVIFIFGLLKFIDIFKNKKDFFKNTSSNLNLQNEQKKILDNNRQNIPSNISLLSEKYILQGIIYDSQNPIALINGKKLSVGDKINDAKVINIFEDGVILEDKDGKTYLSID
ncbi:MAG: hypothetical protein NC935_06990 [Candidatus Omnitrophica bacterium]|nr:hypothetical protein [Candidatus Omnitrophota bacterium]